MFYSQMLAHNLIAFFTVETLWYTFHHEQAIKLNNSCRLCSALFAIGASLSIGLFWQKVRRYTLTTAVVSWAQNENVIRFCELCYIFSTVKAPSKN